MRRTLILSLTLMLAACGGSDDSKVTETRMDDIDSLQGTISDEMVNADELNEQAMVEASPAAVAKPKAKATAEEKPAAPVQPIDKDEPALPSVDE
jgi:outer membrane biosynthesis protein TonB